MRSPIPCARSLPPLVVVALAALSGCSGNVVTEGPPGSATGGTGAGAGGATTTSGAGATSTGGVTTTSSSGITTTTTSGVATTSSSSSTSTSTSGTTTTADCMTLADEYEQALAIASHCNSCGNDDGCSLGVVYPDVCGCGVVLAGSNLMAIEAAKLAWGNWMSAGCPQLSCPCPPTGSSCKPTGSCGGICLP